MSDRIAFALAYRLGITPAEVKRSLTLQEALLWAAYLKGSP